MQQIFCPERKFSAARVTFALRSLSQTIWRHALLFSASKLASVPVQP
jgi:hypothetical protein